jgi:hypothetical protein
MLLPFPVSASLWIAGQQALVVGAVALTARATGWWPGRWHLLALCLAAMTFRYSMVTFVLGQTSIWVLFGLSLALWAMRQGHSTVAGLALAAGCIKPQLMFLPALALIVAVPSRQRRPLVRAFAGSLLFLLICSFLFAGFWLDDYWHQLQAYQGYSPTVFPMAVVARIFLPDAAAQALNVAGIAALLAVLALVLIRCRVPGRPAVVLATAIVITQLAVPQTGSYNLVLLLLPALVLMRYARSSRVRWNGFASMAQLFAWIVLLLLPWLFWAIAEGNGSWPPELVMVPASMLPFLLALCRGQIRRGIPEHTQRSIKETDAPGFGEMGK